MIITGIFNMFYFFILAVSSPIRLLPKATLSSETAISIATAGTYLKSLDFVFPVSNFLTILVLFMSIEAGILIYKLIMWVIKKIPTIS
jgi:hypothetical protein